MARLIPGFEQMFDGAGDPLVNGLLDFFESGSSSVRKDTFSDSAETPALKNANPVVLLADGRVPNVFGTGEYNVILRTSAGVQILPRDPIGGLQGLTFGSDWVVTRSYFQTDVVREGGFYWESLVTPNINNEPSEDDGTNWHKIDFSPFGDDWNKTLTYELTDVTRDAGKYWEAITAGNTGNQPSVSPTNWKEIQFNPIRFSQAAGTADVLTVVFSPPLTAADLAVDGQQVRVRALLANATTTPTFNPDALGAATITKNGNQPLGIGDIPGVNFEMILRRNTGNDVWELLNPAASIVSVGADTDLSNLTATGDDKVCTAWVNFNGTGGVVIRDSFNIVSITDLGTGNYACNFTVGLADSIYSVVTSGVILNAGDTGSHIVSTSTSSVIVFCATTSGSGYDSPIVTVQVFGGN